MNKLIRWVNKVLEEQGLSNLILIITVSATIILLVTSVFLPLVFTFLEQVRVFEILVLTLLVETTYESAKTKREGGITTLPSDYVAQQMIDALLASGDIVYVDFLSAGLASRYALIAKMVSHGTHVRVVVQHPSVAVDKEDAKRLPFMVKKTYDQIDPSLHNNLSIRYSTNTASVRAMILYNSQWMPICALVGWYTYQGSNTAIIADPWPVIWGTATSSQGRLILQFAKSQFDRNLRDAKDSFD